jgi:hypothetical protein
LVLAAGVGCSVLIGIGAVILQWQRINGDGVSYLEMGGELLKSGLRKGYTGYWAPLYGVLGALAARAAEACALDRLIGVQVLNGVLYCLAVAGSLYFMRELLRCIGVGVWCWSGVALQLCGMGALCLLAVRFGGVTLVTPDMAVAGVVFLAAGWTVRLLTRGGTHSDAAWMGALFGIGYWCKSIFLPLVILWIGLMGIAWRNKPTQLKMLGVFVGVWIGVAAPLIAGISLAAGRLSFGENGRLNFLWYVNGIPNRYWEGSLPMHGILKHPMRKVLDSPPIYAFGEVFPKATYPPWYDPAYWYEGAAIRVSVPEIMASIRRNLGSMRRLWLSRYSIPFTLLALLGVFFGWGESRNWIRWMLLCFAAGPFLLILIHTEPRFFYAQVVIMITCGAASLLVVTEDNSRMKMTAATLLAIAACFGWLCALPVLAHSGRNQDVLISKAVRAAGVNPGMRICTIAEGAGTANWAWMLRARIAGEMPAMAYRWVMAERRELPDDVASAFDKAGCDVAVAVLKDGDPAPNEWTRPCDLPVYVRMLK